MFGLVDDDLLLRRRYPLVLQDLGEVLARHLAGDSADDGMYCNSRSRLPRGPSIAACFHLQRRRRHQGDVRLLDAILQVRIQWRTQSGMGLQQEPPG
jgi:hypothetical protein